MTVSAPTSYLPPPDVLTVAPAPGPVVGLARVPGSKSITNRALILAALARGKTILTNALFADDTARMMDCLQALGFFVDVDQTLKTVTVSGHGGKIPANRADLFVGNSGTTARFVTPLCALGTGDYCIDGVTRMRERPAGDLIRALRELGANVESMNGSGCPPLRVRATGLKGGTATVRADVSSQFLSGLLMAMPCADGAETRLHLDGPLLSGPYIEITTRMMRAFGGGVHEDKAARTYVVPGRQVYETPNGGQYDVEPDASAASYFFAAAATTNGRVRIEGAGANPLQGDWAFVDVLESMGCRVTRENGAIEVAGGNCLRGITVDMNAISDTVMTLAAVAPFADTPTVIENVAHIRHKETDRLHAVATELMRLGVRVDERADGLTIYPAQKQKWMPSVVQTYDDHRMAMAFALIGLRVPGVQIADPACVNKTFPDYFARLDDLVARSNAV